jgi:5-methylcytosine-specific restriction endonuclease McrA
MKKALNEPVLILNKNWMPIKVRNVKKAILLASRERACIVSCDDYSVLTWNEWIKLPCKEGEGITTVRGSVRIPKVIVLTAYGKVPTSAPRLTKKNIFIRDENICQYTGRKVSKKDADIDHVIPLSRNGKNAWDNMVVCAKDVNRMKANRTPEEAGLKLIKQPKKPTGAHLMLDPDMEIPEEWSKFI